RFSPLTYWGGGCRLQDLPPARPVARIMLVFMADSGRRSRLPYRWFFNCRPQDTPARPIAVRWMSDTK
ncbi:MAG: hypothetical protein LBQ75_01935, partial [Zoogloeaceae bacterium]|nr:hypothetical protein [Zoogloeaceae bacterium]